MGYKSSRTVISVLQLLIFFTLTEATTTFYRATLCDVKTRLANKCMTSVNKPERIVNCCVRCSSDSSCLGASVQLNTSSCYIHTQCSGTTDCSKGDPGFKYYSKRPDKLPCVYGTWNEATWSCKCSYPRVGKLCDRLPTNCTEFGQYWPTTYGDSMIALNPSPINRNVITVCSRTKDSLSTIVLRNVGEQNFNRTLSDYVQGFLTNPPPYNLSFWVGMDAMPSLLGPTPRNMRISIFFNSATPKRYDYRYSGVVLGDSSTNYMLTYESYTALSGAPNGNCLELSNMTSFSTWDSDNDKDSTENWASRAGAGWWFPSSNFTCNPLGAFYNKSTPPTDDGYLRFPGISTDLIRNNLVRIELHIEDPYA
ncbi:unnamed protein product [Candidula unifasciata]|uniref:Fibrinogen C-terminal domain-containing protein n=1 Tax=Candidula unifasciata TaxID=100452 RepID=A0A8S4A3U6_9EUPU|nr:unnamed protein product [Candidula unifasciata]